MPLDHPDIVTEYLTGLDLLPAVGAILVIGKLTLEGGAVTALVP